MPRFLTIAELAPQDKTVLVRADLNVPMKDGRVTDITRLSRLVPTILELKSFNAKIVILSHFGRPDGKREDAFSLRPVATALGAILEEPVSFADDCIGETAEKAIQALAPKGVLVLENTRFYPEEEANDRAFAKKLAALGDLYINDAFATAHRAHASTAAIASFLPSGAGKLMQEELEALSSALETPKHPVAAIIGGSKVSTKLDLLRNVLKKVDILVLGGGMANTFLAAQGCAIGKSLFEENMLKETLSIVKEAQKNKRRIILPKDVVVAASPTDGASAQTVLVSAIPPQSMILDVGPETIQEIRQTLATCSTLIWNGPLGVFEQPPFDAGTMAVAKVIAELTKETEALSIAGGGDTLAAITQANVMRDISYASTAGGAFLEWLEGKTLPGVAALEAAKDRPH